MMRQTTIDARVIGLGVLLLLSAAVTRPTTGQDKDPLGVSSAKETVTAKASLPPDVEVHPGKAFPTVVTVTVQKGWHIYANPPGAENVKPTELVLAKGSAGRLENVEYPSGESIIPPGTMETVSVYEDKVEMKARILLPRDTQPGTAELTLNLRYQACNDRACLAPKTLKVPLRVKVTR